MDLVCKRLNKREKSHRGGRARTDGEQHTLHRRQHAPRPDRGRGVLKQQRTQKAQMRTRQSRLMGEGDQEPMELERGPLDQDMPDQGRLSPELPIEVSQDELIPFDSAAAPQLHSTDVPGVLEEADTYSQCMRLSLEATLLEWVSGDRPTIEGTHHDNDLEDQAQVYHPQPQSTDIEDSNSSNTGRPSGQQPVLDEYLDQLMRAWDKQEKLAEDLEHERLEEEFSLSHQEQPVLEPSPRPPEGQNSPPMAPDDQPAVTRTRNTNQAQAILAEPTQEPLPASRREGQPETSVENELVASTTQDGASNPLRPADAEPPTPVESPSQPALVEISFWSFE